MKSGFGVLAAILGSILILIISPWIIFWIAYFGGWIASGLIGEQLVAGFALFGLDIPINKIPLIAGCLGWIGGYFKTYNVRNNK